MSIATAPVAPRPAGQRRLSGAVGRAVAAHPVLAVFAVALLARVVLAAYVAVQYGGYLFEDDLGYVTIAAQAASGQTQGWDEYTHRLYDSNATLLYPITALFRAFGTHAALAQLYVALAGALTAALVTRLALEMGGRRAAVGAGLLVALLPSQVLFSSVTLKDALVWAALSAIAVLVAVAGRVHGRRLLGVGAAALVVLVLLGFLRQHTLVVALWALVLTSWTGDRCDRLARVAAALCLAVAVPWALGAGPAGASIVRGAGSLETQRALGAQGAATALVAPAPTGGSTGDVPETSARLAQKAQQARDAAARAQVLAASQAARSAPAAERARAEAARLQLEAEQLAARAAEALVGPVSEPPAAGGVFGTLDDASATTSNLAYLPRGLAVMVLRPLPWESTDNKRLRLAQAENVLWYPILAFALVGLLGLRRHARVLAYPLVLGAGTAVMWALVEGNFGTAYRHRGEFVWAVAALSAGGFAVLSRGSRSAEGHAKPAIDPESHRVDAGGLLYDPNSSSGDRTMTVRAGIGHPGHEGTT